MKKKRSAHFTAVSVFVALAACAQLQAQQPRYKLIDMGTLGGSQSYLNSGNDGNNAVTVLSNRGVLAGWADTSTPDPFPAFCFNEDCFVSHAFRWHSGVRTDLGALDSALSSQAVWISENGLIAGTSENGEFDPLFNGLPEIRAVLWRKGHITDLGTLPEGGFESSANAVNTKGQVAGWATNTIPDANSMAAPGFLPAQTRAFLWQNGTMQDLGTLGTGTDAIAQFINEREQVVGWSYTGAPLTGFCIFPLATGSFIWDKANGIRSLGNLGGGCTIATGINNQGLVIGDNVNDQTIQRAFLWRDGVIQDLGGSIGGEETAAEAINESGQVAGVGTLTGELLYHATLWRRLGEIIDLGVLDGDLCSFASSINSKRQIVGASQTGTPNNGCTFDSSTRAFLWEDGSILDLNTLVPPGASLHLQWALDINDRGEIAGFGLDTDGNAHDFLLIPCTLNRSSDCQEEIVGATEASRATTVPPAQRPQLVNPGTSFRQMLHRRLGPLPMVRSLGARDEHPSNVKASEISSCGSANPGSNDLLDDLKLQLAPAPAWGTCIASYGCSSEVTSCRFCGDICPLMHAWETCWDLKYHRYCHRCA